MNLLSAHELMKSYVYGKWGAATSKRNILLRKAEYNASHCKQLFHVGSLKFIKVLLTMIHY